MSAAADIQVSPVLLDEKKDPSAESITDEKLVVDDHELEYASGNGPLVDLRTAALSDNVGDVYDNVRVIDMGADGKERPIGEYLLYHFAVLQCSRAALQKLR
jgi:hypothetical protein